MKTNTQAIENAIQCLAPLVSPIQDVGHGDKAEDIRRAIRYLRDTDAEYAALVAVAEAAKPAYEAMLAMRAMLAKHADISMAGSPHNKAIEDLAFALYPPSAEVLAAVRAAK